MFSRRLHFTLLSFTALVSMSAFGCGTLGGSTGSNNTNGTSGGSYNGPYKANVAAILKRYTDQTGDTLRYPTSATDPNTASDIPNTIVTLNITSSSCLRDTYVAGAVSAAWAAEAHARIGNASAAQDNVINDMLPQLRQADALCSSSPVIGTPATCTTIKIWGCSDVEQP